MNKKELAGVVAQKLDLKKKDVLEILDTTLDTIQETLAEGERVQLVGFGYFEVRDRKSRTGRNPRKPEAVVEVPPTKAPVFKPGKVLKKVINGED